MKQAQLNFIIDAVGLVLFVALASTGLVMQFTLPPGSTRMSALWGMNRHKWGEIHFWIAMGLLIVIGLHLLMHWRWVLAMAQGSAQGAGRGMRTSVMLGVLLILVAALVGPLLLPVEQITEDTPHYGGSLRGALPDGDDAGVSGEMTLHDLEVSTGVSTEIIWRELGLAGEPEENIRLGELRKTHGFTMKRVREVVEAHRDAKVVTTREAPIFRERMSR